MTSPIHPTIELTAKGARIVWGRRDATITMAIDHVDGAHPNWIGSAADLDDLADRRTSQRVIDLLVEFAEQRHETVALYHDDGRLEWLVEPSDVDP